MGRRGKRSGDREEERPEQAQRDLLEGIEEAAPAGAQEPGPGAGSDGADEPSGEPDEPAATRGGASEPAPEEDRTATDPAGGDEGASADTAAGDRGAGPRSESVTVEMVADGGQDSPGPPPAGERLARAKELVQEGRVREAVALYRDILRANPSSLRARNNLGALFEALGNHEQALEQFEAALKVEPENVEVLNNLGAVLALLARYDESERFLKRAQRLEPDNLEVRANMGILHFRRGLYAQCEVELRRVCNENEDHGPAFFYRGEALNRLGRYDDALDALERATVLQPWNAKAFYTMGILYDRRHLPEEAAAMYRRAREAQAE